MRCILLRKSKAGSLGVMMLLVILAAQAATSTASVVDCRFDRARLMALDQNAFDQDMTGGWRKLEQDGCEVEAADLVRDWRTAHQSRDSILFWHEGQLRADIGQTAQAIALFKQSYKPASGDRIGWNLYVDGTIAFLLRDRTRFDKARSQLAVLPRPADLTFEGPDGKPVPIRWPMNLSVLDGFGRCWDQPYKLAYACATPIRRVTVPDSK